ncbi:MAG: ABC transporter ATP-binding protein [Bacteroidota bacterium]
MARVQLTNAGVTFRIFDAGQRSFKRRILPFYCNGSEGVEIAALSDVTLTLEPGSRVALLGTNSSGKTTLLRVIAGLVAPQRGTATIEGTPGAVFSMGFGVDREASLADLAYAQGLLMGLPASEARAKAADILNFAELVPFADCQGHVASPGLLSRLGIAAILCLGADIILLDEVLENMDPSLYQKFEDAILKRVSEGAVLVMAERSRSLLTRFCSEAVLLRDGQIAERAPLATIMLNAGAHLTF